MSKFLKLFAIVLMWTVGQMAYAKTLGNLDGKSIFRTYLNNMFSYYPNEDEISSFDLEDKTRVGIENSDGSRSLAVFRGVKQFINTAGEYRYLAIIEKIPMLEYVDEYGGQDWSLSFGCHACSSDLLLISFKKLDNQNFKELAKLDYQAAGSWGRAELLQSDFKVMALGLNTMGISYESNHCGGGSCEGTLRMLMMDDNQIRDVYVADTWGQNYTFVDENSPLAYSFQSDWRVDTSDPGRELYPIIINYEGDKVDTDHRGKPIFTDMNRTQIFEFDKKSGQYKLTKSYSIQ